MSSDDSFNDSDEIFNLYNPKKVTETFQNHFRKLVSNGIRSNVGKGSEDVLKNVKPSSSSFLTRKEKPSGSIKAKEDIQPKRNKKVRNTKDIISDVSENESGLEDSISIIEIVEEDLSPRPLRKSARLRKKRSEVVYDLDDSPTVSPEPEPRSRKRTLNSGRKGKNKKKNVAIEEIVLDDSIEPSNDLDEDELNPEVSVKIIWKSVTVKKFYIRKFQKMLKIYEQLSAEENVPKNKIVLTLNNVKISPDDSPASLDLRICHFIDGGVLSELNSFELSDLCNVQCNDVNSIILKFQDGTKKVVKISLNKDDKMKIGMIKYAEQIETPLEKIKFFFDGESLEPSETPTSLGLEGDEVVDVKILP